MAEEIKVSKTKLFFDKIPKTIKVGFLVSLLIGFVCYSYCIFNPIINHDGVYNLTNLIGVASGRWFLHLSNNIRGSLAIPSIIGFFALLYIALTVTLTISICKVKKTSTAVLIALIMTTFPVIGEIALYNFTFDLYMMALLLSTFAVYLFKKFKFGWIGSVICLTLAAGNYQTFYVYGLCLYIFSLVLDCINQEKTFKQTIIDALKFIAVFVGTFILYILISKFFLALFNEQLTSYIIQTDKNIFVTIFENFGKTMAVSFDTLCLFGNSLLVKINLVYSLVFVIFCFVCLFCKKSITVKQKLLIVALCLALAVSSIAVGLIGTQVHGLMFYEMVLFYLLVIMLLEKFSNVEEMPIGKSEKTKNSIINFFKISICFVVGCATLNSIVITNQAHYTQDILFQQTVNYSTRLVSAIESLPEYNEDREVLLVRKSNSIDPIFVANYLNDSYTGLSDMLSWPYETFLSTYLRFNPKGLSAEKYTVFVETYKTNIDALTIYPNGDTWHDLIDGVLVVVY